MRVEALNGTNYNEVICNRIGLHSSATSTKDDESFVNASGDLVEPAIQALKFSIVPLVMKQLIYPKVDISPQKPSINE